MLDSTTCRYPRRAPWPHRLRYFLNTHGVDAPLHLKGLALFIAYSALPLVGALINLQHQSFQQILHGWSAVEAIGVLSWGLAGLYLLVALEIRDWRDLDRLPWTF